MHLFSSALLFSLTVSAAPSTRGNFLQNRDDASNISILTSYFGYDGCSGDQKTQVMQAQKDAVMLATNAVKNPGINWGSDPAAIDFFGPADETQNRGTRQHIIDQLQGAAKSYPGTGLSDWYNGRYVDLQCHDSTDFSCSNAAAYTRLQINHDQYPTIVFCPGFFSDARPSLASAKATIDKNAVLQGWVSALQSQALTFMHELFHIDFGTAQISKPPAKDQWISVGPQGAKDRIQAYKPGRAKLLAMTKNNGPQLASQNNDGLAYFTAAIYMTGLYNGNYPAKPRAWNPELSIEDNKKNDEIPPGLYSIAVDDFEAPDADPDDGDPNAALSISASDLFPDSEYPASYISTYGSPTAGDNPSVSSATPSPSVPPPSYATGTCSFHLTETQDCDSDYGNNLYGNVVMKDNNKAIIGQTVNDDDHAIGYAMDDGNPYSFDSKLPHPLVITGEHENDYVQFTYGSLSWQSKTPNGGGSCTVGGWDPRDGPVCDFRVGNQNAVNNMDCSFPC